MNKVTSEMAAHLEEKGFFVVRGVVNKDTIAKIRQCIVDRLQNPEDTRGGQDKEGFALDQSEDSLYKPENYRKLAQFGRHAAEIWEGFLAHQNVLDYVYHFLGKDAVLKFDSVFLKPAKVGGATPWHQDIGLWRDRDVTACNCWMAVDAATIENGCLQFVPGSHKQGTIPHVLYDDSIHGELPKEVLEGAERVHCELQPGDAVFWLSDLFHYSPPNTSEKGRIGLGSVWSSAAYAGRSEKPRNWLWAMKGGLAQPFPPQQWERVKHEDTDELQWEDRSQKAEATAGAAY